MNISSTCYLELVKTVLIYEICSRQDIFNESIIGNCDGGWEWKGLVWGM